MFHELPSAFNCFFIGGVKEFAVEGNKISGFDGADEIMNNVITLFANENLSEE